MTKAKRIKLIFFYGLPATSSEWQWDDEFFNCTEAKLDLLARLVNTLIDEVNKLKEGGQNECLAK